MLITFQIIDYLLINILFSIFVGIFIFILIFQLPKLVDIFSYMMLIFKAAFVYKQIVHLLNFFLLTIDAFFYSHLQ